MTDHSDAEIRTILVVEDDEMVRRGIRAVLQSSGYRVVEAYDGAHALEVLDSLGLVDMILTDIFMPRMNGPDLVKNLPPERRPPVIFMSGHPDAGASLQNPSLASAGFIAKPFDPEDLLTKVRSGLNAPHSQSPRTG